MSDQEESRKKPRRSFSEAWLKDDRFKSWIRRVSSDDSLYHCAICEKNISCNTHILRHVNSACHKISLREGKSYNKRPNKRIPEKRKFKHKWLEMKLFKPWIREVPNDRYSFFCTFCEKSLVGGLSQIYRHAKSKAHVEIIKNKIEIKNGQNNQHIIYEDIDVRDESNLFEERKKAAEIRYVAFIADENISHKTAKDILSFFQEVGTNPNVLRNMSI